MSGSNTVGSQNASTQNDTKITIQQDQSNNHGEQGSVGDQVGSGSLQGAFKSIHLHEATGWTILGLNVHAFTPTLDLYPTIPGGPLLTQAPVYDWRMKAEPDCGCCCNCCSPKEKGFRSYSVQSAGVEVMSFRYRPHLWHCSCIGKRTVDIFIPQRTERIDWIECIGNFEEGSTITDGITGAAFPVSYYINNFGAEKGMRVSDQLGNTMISCQATDGVGARNGMLWTTFEMEYLPPMENTALSSRAVLLVAFQLWLLMVVEKGARCSITVGSCGLFTVTFVFASLFLWRRLVKGHF